MARFQTNSSSSHRSSTTNPHGMSSVGVVNNGSTYPTSSPHATPPGDYSFPEQDQFYHRQQLHRRKGTPLPSLARNENGHASFLTSASSTALSGSPASTATLPAGQQAPLAPASSFFTPGELSRWTTESPYGKTSAWLNPKSPHGGSAWMGTNAMDERAGRPVAGGSNGRLLSSSSSSSSSRSKTSNEGSCEGLSLSDPWGTMDVQERLKLLRNEYKVYQSIAKDVERARRLRQQAAQVASRQQSTSSTPEDAAADVEMADSSPYDSGADDLPSAVGSDDFRPNSSGNQSSAFTGRLSPREVLRVSSSSVSSTPSSTPSDAICLECGTTSTPQWRKGWLDETLQQPVTLCNACGLKYNKKQFCPLCNKLLAGKGANVDLDVAGCKRCKRHVHVECETRFSGITPVALKSHNSRSRTSKGYFCPDCRLEA